MPNSTITPIMTPARGPGVPDAQPVYLVDVYGNPLSSTNLQSVTVANGNPNGQSTMANSAPVVLPSDQVHAANIDGIVASNLLAQALYIYASGGPPDSTGKPQQASYDRVASVQGKGLGGASGNITATVAGDVQVTFSVAPKTIMPGQKIFLAVGAGAFVETVLVSNSYVPSASATSIPLQYPVVNAGSTTAKWDQYAVTGPGLTAMLPGNIPVNVMALQDPGNPGNFTVVNGAAVDGATSRLILEVISGLVNGAGTIDRQRGNLDNITLVASAAYTATQNSTDQTNYNGRGVIVTLDVTVPGTGSVTLEIDMKDPVSGKYIPLLTGAAVTTQITNVYTVYPGAPATANVSANSPLPRTWRVKVTANNTNSITYSVGASVIL